MNLMHRNQIDRIIGQFEQGMITRKQAVWSLTEMPEHPDFQGIWETLIIHIILMEISRVQPDTEKYRKHWQSEVKAWQNRLNRFVRKSKASYRNAVRKHFYQAADHLFKDEYANLLFSLEIHLEEITGNTDFDVEDILTGLKPETKDMEWFLEYS